MKSHTAIRRVLFVVLLTGCLKDTTATDRNSYHKDLTTTTCDYLQNDGTQFNAYANLEFGDNFCCLCPRGTKFTGDCDLTDPRSTKCSPCPFDSHVDFEPHFQDQCTRKYWRPCPSSKIYSRGSRTKADGCVCPNGMIQDGRTKDCVFEASSKPTSIDTRHSTTTSTIATTSTTATTTRGTSEARSTGGILTRLSIKGDGILGEKSSEFVEPKESSALITVFVVLCVCIVLLVMIAVAYKLFRKHIVQPKSASVESSRTDITDNSGSTPLMLTPEVGQQEAEFDANRCRNHSSTSTEYHTEAQPSQNRALPIQHNGCTVEPYIVRNLVNTGHPDSDTIPNRRLSRGSLRCYCNRNQLSEVYQKKRARAFERIAGKISRDRAKYLGLQLLGNGQDFDDIYSQYSDHTRTFTYKILLEKVKEVPTFCLHNLYDVVQETYELRKIVQEELESLAMEVA